MNSNEEIKRLFDQLSQQGDFKGIEKKFGITAVAHAQVIHQDYIRMQKATSKSASAKASPAGNVLMNEAVKADIEAKKKLAKQKLQSKANNVVVSFHEASETPRRQMIIISDSAPVKNFTPQPIQSNMKPATSSKKKPVAKRVEENTRLPVKKIYGPAIAEVDKTDHFEKQKIPLWVTEGFPFQVPDSFLLTDIFSIMKEKGIFYLDNTA